MRFQKIIIEGFRSIRERQEVCADETVTVLIGANDHGKSNVLRAIQCLNSDTEITSDDRHWDLESSDFPYIEWQFELTDSEVSQLRDAGWSDYMRLTGRLQSGDRESDSTAVEDYGADGEDEEGEVDEDDVADEVDGDDASKSSPTEFMWAPENDLQPERTIGDSEWAESFSSASSRVIRFFRRGLQSKLYVCWDNRGLTVGQLDLLDGLRPKVELFEAVQKVRDQIAPAELEKPEFEFMKGIFLKAGLWDIRQSIFRQTPSTSMQLDRASRRLTETLRTEWEQGRDLEWKFEYGTGGEIILLQIKDPAVNERYVRPSQRSMGFTSFFVLTLTIFARTALDDRHSYLFLFDEPGTYLHPIAQVNLQRVFEALAHKSQIVYTTHSIFLVNKTFPARNNVIQKICRGTVVNRKPYMGNWKAVRDSLGIMLSQNFLISDRTLLVEGPSDEIYLLALMWFLVRNGLRNIDLNSFSIADAGMGQNQAIMAKLMLEEGRRVVVLSDGDQQGIEVRKDLEKMAPEHLANQSLQIIDWPKGKSIEDMIPCQNLLIEAIGESAEFLRKNGIRQWNSADTLEHELESFTIAISTKSNLTLGRLLADTTKSWFKGSDGISKLLIAERYEERLREVRVEKAPKELRTTLNSIDRIMSALALPSAVTTDTIFESNDEDRSG